MALILCLRCLRDLGSYPVIDLPALALNSLVGQVSKPSLVLSLCKENKNRKVPEHNGGKGKKMLRCEKSTIVTWML